MSKHVVRLGATTSTSGGTISESDQSPSAPDRNRFSHMDVVVVLSTFSGTSNTVTFSVQENFGGNWVETGKTNSITAAGTYVLASHTVPAAATASITGAFPVMGKGMDKRVIATVGGTVGAINAEVFLVFYD